MTAAVAAACTLNLTHHPLKLLSAKHPHRHFLLPIKSHSPKASPSLCASAISQPAQQPLEMVIGHDGVYSARSPTVVVLWDLDNKPPQGPPFAAASSLLSVSSLLGRVVDAAAFANRHAFTHVPPWVLSLRREQRELDILERRAGGLPSSLHPCPVCGRKLPTRLDLKRHFRQLHERERQKKLSRLRSLKGKKKRQDYHNKHIAGNHKYEEAARALLTPKQGYGLASELRRAGVSVRTVEDKPQAADAALKRQMLHSVARGVDWLVLVSDDSDFVVTVQKARQSHLRTVVVGDQRNALGRAADIWLPWTSVENGEVDEDILRPQFRREGLKHYSDDDGDDVVMSSEWRMGGMSEFSEEEVKDVANFSLWEEFDQDGLPVYDIREPGDDSSDDEEGDFYCI